MSNHIRPDRTTQIQAIKRNVDLMELIDTSLTRCGSQQGGEYSGPCPFCDGEDRFHIQPDHPNGSRWFCRQCTGDITGGRGKWQDVFDYVQRWRNMDFNQAFSYLADLTNSPSSTTNPSAKAPTTTRNSLPPMSKEYDYQNPIWQTNQQRAIHAAHDSLLFGASKKAKDVQRYASKRHINQLMQEKYRLGAGWFMYSQGTQPGKPVYQNALIIPWYHIPDSNQPEQKILSALQYRFVGPKIDPHDQETLLTQRYGCIGGSKRILFGEDHHNPLAQSLILIEGEINAISIDQAMSDPATGDTKNINVLSWGAESNIHNQETQDQIIANIKHHKYQRILCWADQSKYGATLTCLLTQVETNFRKITIVSPAEDANSLLSTDPSGTQLADFIIQSMY